MNFGYRNNQYTLTADSTFVMLVCNAIVIAFVKFTPLLLTTFLKFARFDVLEEFQLPFLFAVESFRNL